MEAIVYYNETSLNNKYQVMTTLLITGKGVKKYGENYILTHHGEIIKSLNNYWVTKSALEAIKKANQTVRTSFN